MAIRSDNVGRVQTETVVTRQFHVIVDDPVPLNEYGTERPDRIEIFLNGRLLRAMHINQAERYGLVIL